MSDVAPADGIANFKTLLGAISQAGSAAESLLVSLGVKVVQTFEAMNEELSQVALPKLPQAGRWNDAGLATRRFAASLAEVETNLAKNSPDMRRLAVDLKREWWMALSAQARSDEAAAELFKQGKYEEAAKSIGNTLSKGRKEKLLGSIPQLAPIRDSEAQKVIVPLLITTEALETPDVSLETIHGPQPAADSINTIEARTFRELLGAKLAQWVISATGLSFVGYLLLADKFVGTAPEMLTAFFWGFTTDVGLDALISAGKPKLAG